MPDSPPKYAATAAQRGTRHPGGWFVPWILAAALAGCGGGSEGGGGGGSTPPEAGEPFRVTDTVPVNTLLGYGEERPQMSFLAYIRSEQAGGDILWGTDLGLPVTLPNAGAGGADLTLFLFGDTDQLDLDWLEQTHKVRKLQPAAAGGILGPAGPFEGDAIGRTTDADPSDGVHLDHVYRNVEPGDPMPVCADPGVRADGFRPVYLAGVHGTEIKLPAQIPPACVQVLPNTTPTGAWVVDGTVFMLAAVQKDDEPDNGLSYLAASRDQGLHWTVLNGGRPFSERGRSARFIHGFGVSVDASDYQDPQRSGPCLLPLPKGGDTRGILLFGSGLWKYPGNNVYLAFFSRSELQAAAADPNRRLTAWYFAGTDRRIDGHTACWSQSEQDAVPVVRVDDLSAYARFEQACGTAPTSAGIGYTSVIHVDETLVDGRRIDRLVMLLSPAYQGVGPDGPFDADLGTVLITGDPLRPWIWNLKVPESGFDGRPPAEHRFRPLPVAAAPTSGLMANEPHCKQSGIAWGTVSGYAPLLIDRYTRRSADGLGVDLYFLISRSNVLRHPDDPQPDLEIAYHYVVDVMRTTLRPLP